MSSIYYTELPVNVPVRLGSLNLTGVHNGAHWIVENIVGWEFADIEVRKENRGNRDGVYRGKSFYRGRPIEVEGVVIGDTRQAAHAALDALNGIVGRINNNTPLHVTEMVERMVWVRGEERPLKVEWLDHLRFRYSLDLYADFPFRVSPQLHRVVAELNVGLPGRTYPKTYTESYGVDFTNFAGFGVTVTNAGNAPAYPIITFHGPLINPILDLPRTDVDFVLNTEVPVGQTVVMDSWNGIILLNGRAPRGAWAINQTFPIVEPDAPTIFRLLGDGSGYVTVEWRDTWF